MDPRQMKKWREIMYWNYYWKKKVAFGVFCIGFFGIILTAAGFNKHANTNVTSSSSSSGWNLLLANMTGSAMLGLLGGLLLRLIFVMSWNKCEENLLDLPAEETVPDYIKRFKRMLPQIFSCLFIGGSGGLMVGLYFAILVSSKQAIFGPMGNVIALLIFGIVGTLGGLLVGVLMYEFWRSLLKGPVSTVEMVPNNESLAGENEGSGDGVAANSKNFGLHDSQDYLQAKMRANETARLRHRRKHPPDLVVSQSADASE